MKRRRRGRPKGTKLTLARDRQNAAIALWKAFRVLGYGTHEAGYLALMVVGGAPIQLEDVEGVLTVASTTIKYKASTLDKHVNALARKAARASDHDPWLVASTAAIRGLIRGIRTNRIELAAYMFDVLIELGWRVVLARFWARIQTALRSNIPPHEGPLGRAQASRLKAYVENSRKRSEG